MTLFERNPVFRGFRKLPAAMAILLGLVVWNEGTGQAGPLRASFQPVDDTYVRSGFSSKKNFGRESALEVQGSRGSVSEAYIKFDLAGTDPLFKEARLRIFASAEKADPTTMEMRLVPSNNWLENIITWKDKPDAGNIVANIQTVGTSGGWYEIDITALVKQEFASGNDTLSFAFTLPEAANNKILIQSREADSNVPEVVISRSLFNAKIVFQPQEKTTPSGYLADSGLPLGQQRNGMIFGWSADVSKFVRDRNNPDQQENKPVKSPDIRYTGIACMDHPDMSRQAQWEISVPNGEYKVHAVAGDPCNYDSIYAINAEDVLILEGNPDSNKRWVEGTKTVTVRDGRLTLSNHPKGINNKLCFVEIAEINKP